jgi:hypothetical protein
MKTIKNVIQMKTFKPIPYKFPLQYWCKGPDHYHFRLPNYKMCTDYSWDRNTNIITKFLNGNYKYHKPVLQFDYTNIGRTSTLEEAKDVIYEDYKKSYLNEKV